MTLWLDHLLFGNWHGLPPLYFLAGSTEILLDDSVRAYDRALQAGVDAHIDVWTEMPHVFPLFAMLPEAKDAVRRIAAFIAKHAGREAAHAVESSLRAQNEDAARTSPLGSDSRV